jgi:hypothetical protein
MSMKRLLSLLIMSAVVAAGCGASGDDPETSPAAVVASWAEAVEVRDFDAATDAVFDPSLVIVLAAENNLPASDTAEMLNDGITPAAAAAYWSSFRDGFDAFAGRPISTLNVGAPSEIEAGGEMWAKVPVSVQEAASAPAFTRDADGWAVDMVATLAPGFVEPLLSYLQSTPEDEDGATIRDAYATVVVPAMWVAIEAGDHDDEFARRALVLIEASGG